MKKPELFTTKEALPDKTQMIDSYDTCLAELFYIQNPTIDKRNPANKDLCEAFVAKAQGDIGSVWVYYEYANLAVRVPDEETFYTLRTARNKDLIYKEEQEAYRNCSIGIVGLSVGSAILSSIVQTGGPKQIKIADPDTIELTNLNRMKATLLDITQNKATIAAKNVWELDPFTELAVWESGVTKATLETFITGSPKLDIFIDEMDDIALKIASRVLCREQKIPVVMATDNGDSVIIDIERFDLETNRPLFHGQLTEADHNFDPKSMADFITMANKIIDPNFFTERQLASIKKIGTSLSGVPQLATAAAIAGASIAFVVRQIANKSTIPSGRYVIGCETTFAPKEK